MVLDRPITPHLWFDTQAREAAEFYVSVFPESRIDSATVLHDTPSGDCDVISFTLAGQPFMAISAGPLFTFNPSISFFVNFDPAKDPQARERLDIAWEKLAEGGQVLMELGEYPFATRYGWVQDRYGLSWQLILANPAGEQRPAIVPSFLFTGDAYGQAEAAGDYWRGEIDDSRPGQLVRYEEATEHDRAGAVMFSDFRLGPTWFAAMDSGYDHGFGFNEAVSFIVHCRDQAEIDRYWEKLSAHPENEQCGWCKDRFGVSWQVSPIVLDEVMTSDDQAAIDRVTQVFLPMKKLDVATIEKAAKG